MSLRFRRSVRLFPGVRLNFSRSGISTTVGVRGATMTVGQRGAHVNVGLPGSGISYRTRISHSGTQAPAQEQQRSIPASPQPEFAPPPSTATLGRREIRSADVSTLTSPGLGELKLLINEVATRRAALVSEVASDERTLAKAIGRLKWARAFVVRIFTSKSIPRLDEAAHSAAEKLEESKAELAACFVEVDFGFDDATADAYSTLIRSFDELRECQCIWDITSTAPTNRVAERTIATQSVTRVRVHFDYVTSQIVKSRHQAMRLGNVAGRNLQIFPGFIMMQDLKGDFALLEFREFDLRLSRTRFNETDSIPADSEIVGQTWEKANKDGSPDRRFKDNHAIPIALYGELNMSSPTGLLESYMFSNPAKAEAFFVAFNNHKRALANLTTPLDVEPPAGTDDGDEGGAPEPQIEIGAASIPPAKAQNLILDYFALVVIVVAFSCAGVWLAKNAREISAAFGSGPAQAIVAPVSAAPEAPPEKIIHHVRHRHRRMRQMADSGTASTEPIQ